MNELMRCNVIGEIQTERPPRGGLSENRQDAAREITDEAKTARDKLAGIGVALAKPPSTSRISGFLQL
jgi:hypothetical protein